MELADNIVCLGDIMIAYQLKERDHVAETDAATERRWFENKVLGKATRQIRDTEKYLRAHESIELENAQSRTLKSRGSLLIGVTRNFPGKKTRRWRGSSTRAAHSGR